MAEPFKNLFNVGVIAEVGSHFARASAVHGAEFDEAAFRRTAGHELDALELKERSRQIESALADYLPADFRLAGEIIGTMLDTENDAELAPAGVADGGLKGIALMPVADYVAQYGQDHVEQGEVDGVATEGDPRLPRVACLDDCVAPPRQDALYGLPHGWLVVEHEDARGHVNPLAHPKDRC